MKNISVLTSSASDIFRPTSTGKVRDLYNLGDQLLLVATDRLSAFDVILPDGIPNKGKVLTQISSFWFKKLSSIVKNHVVTTNATEFPEPFRSSPSIFADRSMLVKKTEPLPVECVARGYLSGSGWTDYLEAQSVSGIRLPDGLRESDQLSEPIFTPSTKAPSGTHDESIPFDALVRIVGAERAEEVRSLTLTLYRTASDYAASRGIIIADTKFEFGINDVGELIWIDEALTPDSSRFWPADQYTPGGPQQSFDKQFVRDYLLSIKWGKKPPAPQLPRDIIEKTRKKYEEALFLLTGEAVQ